jgi:hypothetical protein
MVQQTGQPNPLLRSHRQFNFHVFQEVREPKDAYRMVGTNGDIVLAA